MKTLNTLILLVTFNYSFGQTSNEFSESGEIKIKNRNFNGALIDYRKALEKERPEASGFILDRLAYCYFELGEFDKALTHIGQALKLDNKSVSPRLTRAWIFTKRKDNQSALQEYDTIISITNNNWLVYYGRADLYRSLGKRKLAINDFERVKDISLTENDSGLFKSAAREIERLKR